jgi:hypothetical protein
MLLAAAATPLPVQITNPPGPDYIAYALGALGIIVSAAAAAFAYKGWKVSDKALDLADKTLKITQQDFDLTMKQYNETEKERSRKAALSLFFDASKDQTVYVPRNIARTGVNNMRAVLMLRLLITNTGDRVAREVGVRIVLPSTDCAQHIEQFTNPPASVVEEHAKGRFCFNTVNYGATTEDIMPIGAVPFEGGPLPVGVMHLNVHFERDYDIRYFITSDAGTKDGTLLIRWRDPVA